MPYIKIKQPGFETFSDLLGSVQFKDGQSVEPVSQAEADRIGAIMPIECVDTGAQVGATQRLIDTKDLSVETRNLEEVIKAEGGAESTSESVEGENTVEPVEPVASQSESQEGESGSTDDKSDADADAEIYTQESLEKIADEQGIKGLRVIGDKVGAKANSIPELIERILKKAAE